jgi:putative phosphoesterase
MRAAVISDTHIARGRRRLPSACLERLREADLILHAGDLCERRVLDQLLELGPPVTAVQGNADSLELRNLLPAVAEVDVDGLLVVVIHDGGPARGRLVRLRREHPEADVVVFGHSHIPLHQELAGFHIFNPGSPTDRRRQPEHTMGELHFDGEEPEFEIVRLGR